MSPCVPGMSVVRNSLHDFCERRTLAAAEGFDSSGFYVSCFEKCGRLCEGALTLFIVVSWSPKKSLCGKGRKQSHNTVERFPLAQRQADLASIRCAHKRPWPQRCLVWRECLAICQCLSPLQLLDLSTSSDQTLSQFLPKCALILK